MKRIEWVDIIKGIASILVVVSHVHLKAEYLLITKTIYLFCMPLYFFVSGYMYKKRDNFKEHFQNKCYQLIIPYFALLLLFLPVSVYIFPTYTNLFTSNSTFIDLVRYFTGRTIGNMVTGSIWFLTCLFFTQIVYNVIRVKFKLRTVHIIVFIMLLLSYVNHHYSIHMYYKWMWLPFYAHLILASIPIYHIGHLYRKYEVKDNRIVLTICAIIAMIGIIYIPDNVYNIVDSFYGVPFFTLFCSITLIIVVKNIAVGIFKYNIIPSLFINLGKASIVIMAFHLSFVIVFEKMLQFPPIITIVLSTSISLGIYFIFKYFTITRALFMGRKEDARIIKQKIYSYIKK